MKLQEEYRTSLGRGLLAALIAGSLGFLYQWVETDEVKQLVASGAIPFLTTLGGFARDGAGAMYYLTTVAEDLTTSSSPSGVHRPNIANLVKLSPLGAEVFRTDLRTDIEWNLAEPLYSPMTWGTSQLAVGDGRVIVTMSCNTEYDAAVSSRHQWHISIGADAATVQGAPGILATVSVARQQMEVVVDNGTDRQTYTWTVSTARPGYATPRGTYQPTWLDIDHRSREYDDAPMPFAVFFSGGYAVHATEDVRHLGRPASHGCVRLAPQDAAQFYNLVAAYGRSNTQIVIVD